MIRIRTQTDTDVIGTSLTHHCCEGWQSSPPTSWRMTGYCPMLPETARDVKVIDGCILSSSRRSVNLCEWRSGVIDSAVTSKASFAHDSSADTGGGDKKKPPVIP
eukprot:scaffold25_cov190-Alexandrium_tamarense.AAC.20